jgi:hypothetical protein
LEPQLSASPTLWRLRTTTTGKDQNTAIADNDFCGHPTTTPSFLKTIGMPEIGRPRRSPGHHVLISMPPMVLVMMIIVRTAVQPIAIMIGMISMRKQKKSPFGQALRSAFGIGGKIGKNVHMIPIFML